MPSPLIQIDDKHVPLYRIIWIADLPHFCGVEDCPHEGYYEVRLEADDSIWTNLTDRDRALDALKNWCGEGPEEDGESWR